MMMLYGGDWIENRTVESRWWCMCMDVILHGGALRGIEVEDNRPHEILERIRCRKMKAHLGGLLPYAGADFEHTELDRVKVGRRPLSAAHANLLDCVQKHVGRAVQEEAKMVC